MLDLTVLHNTAWLVDPSHAQLLATRLAGFDRCFTGREVAAERKQRLAEARQAGSLALQGSGVDHVEERAAARPIRAAKGKVGVIPVHGPVEQRLTSALMKLGGTSTEEVGAALDALLNDSSVEAIVLHVDSPGGGIYGVEELSDKIYAARGRKKIYAMADSLAASAAYWIATAAETVVVTPGGDVGSVGVYAIHVDKSKALEKEGLSVTLARAGKYKAEFAPFAPLGDATKGHLQEVVDGSYQKFLAALKRNRGVSLEHVRKEFGEGRLVGAAPSVERKMADRVMTFDQLLARLTGGSGGEGGGRASADVLRRRLAHQRMKEVASG